ncbi:hypothetical protein PENANT_c046G05768 [Penicillium antarcticum]|uniref:LysM domain-containing protein n=1 Tax=Penicillium antarcticum TaxID=416450 RepID=A0A1V6PRM8_9EURO|nr:hypothetical protein PENANT_c046G05768 [Penicillium antarcticum]
MLVAITIDFLSTLCQQTIGRLLPINVDRFTVFKSSNRCMDYGYPSTGGFLIKEADLLVMFFLSLPRSYISQRSPSADEEDRFCNLLRRTGATFWPIGVPVAIEHRVKEIVSPSVLILFFISWAVALEQGNSDTFLSKSVHKCDAVLTATLDGICHIYTVQARDNYAVLATQYGITTTNIETWNTGVWGWTGCDGLKQGSFICLSSGNPPMPAAVPQAVCGPQVPCTARPISMSDLGSLNPCPSVL